jgi:hypothetical protein
MDLLVAIAGAILGISSSPEMWIAVAVVVAFSSSAAAFLIALALAAVALVGLKYALIPGFPPILAVITVVALALWSSIGWGLRTMIMRAFPQDAWPRRP